MSPSNPGAIRVSSTSRPLPRPLRHLGSACLSFLALSVLSAVAAAPQVGLALSPDDPRLDPPGFRPQSIGIHALVNATAHIRPGLILSNATLILNAGHITSVSSPAADAPPIPAGARVWDLAGLTVYAGFIDPYVIVSGESKAVPPQPGESAESTSAGRGSGGSDARASDTAREHRFFGVGDGDSDPGTPGPGAGSRDVTPERRIAATYSPDRKGLEALRELGFTTAQFVPGKGIFRGQAAVLNLSDASPNSALLKPDSAQCIAFQSSTDAPSRDAFPASLMGIIALVRQTFLDAAFHERDVAHFNAFPAGRPRPRANAALDALQSARRDQPILWEPGSILMVDRAVRIADELNLKQRVIVASGHEWRRPDLVPASSGPFIVPLAFPALPKLPDDEAWDAISLDVLRAWDWAPENPAVLQRNGAEFALTTHAIADRKEFRGNLRRAIDRGLTESNALAALTTAPARICGLADRLGTLEAGRIANLTVVAGSYFNPTSKVHSVWIDGAPFIFPEPIPPSLASASADAKDSGTSDTNTVAAATASAGTTSSTTSTNQTSASKSPEPRVAREPALDRGPLLAPPALFIESATLWTGGAEGVVTQANLLVVDGRIQRVGRFLANLPTNAVVIDGTGLHVTPGIIDCHSHSMILGGVNEGTLPSTAMVRIGDVVNSESPNIHLQLAGGVTAVNLLHGSANPIGGQNSVIKLRNGASPENLKFAEAPSGIKFALGENVKQANWGDRYTTRFPQSRMGVPTFMANRFEAARQYRQAMNSAFPVVPGQAPPRPLRRDLELEALAEIIDGSRRVHCHSYRQDEILAFLRTMESFGVRVATLQHILEGYKVADEIARHGAGASAFADWWAYKYEVIDAIPYAGALMHARGVNVSFNSDSSDHARRLQLEAAKAVKYGGVPEPDALKFVTTNPARQLGIEHRVGTLEPGKDADLAIWSGHPLDTRSVCLQTWIEGRKYFDRTLEPERVRKLADERSQLLAKARSQSKSGPDTKASDKARAQFFRRALETARHLGVAECSDCQLPFQP